MLRLRGNVPATVDDKGRLKLPVIFRAAMEELYDEPKKSSKYYLTSIDGNNARLYPLSVWEDLELRLAKIPGTNPVKRKFLEITSYYGAELALDAKDRLLIPITLREAANLTGEVAILGQIDHLVIWNRAIFKCHIVAEPITIDDLSLLANLGI